MYNGICCILIYGVFSSFALVKDNQEILTDFLHSRNYDMCQFCYIFPCAYSFHNN